MFTPASWQHVSVFLQTKIGKKKGVKKAKAYRMESVQRKSKKALSGGFLRLNSGKDTTARKLQSGLFL